MEKTKQKEEIRLPGMFSLLCTVVYGVCLPVSQHTVVHDYDNLFIWLSFSVHVVATVPFRALFSACRSSVWPVLAMVTLLFVEPSGHC